MEGGRQAGRQAGEGGKWGRAGKKGVGLKGASGGAVMRACSALCGVVWDLGSTVDKHCYRLWDNRRIERPDF